MSRGGRPAHDYWDIGGFNRIKVAEKYAAECTVCHSVLTNTAKVRLMGHRNGCKMLPSDENMNRSIMDDPTDNSNDCMSIDDSSNDTILNDESFPNTYRGIVTQSLPNVSTIAEYQKKISTNLVKSTSTLQPTLKKSASFIDILTSQDRDKLDLLLANFFFGCNIPFSVVDSKHFKAFVNELRPAFKPPCRTTLSTSLLDRTHEKMTKEKQSMADKNGVLLIDGWKNSSANTKNVTFMVHNASGNIFFLESFDYTDTSETGEALAETVIEAIDLAKMKFDIDIYAIVSDNASAMKKMGRLVHIWHTTCSSHSANLLAKEIVDERLASQVQSILREFKSSALEKTIVSLGGSKMVLAGDTRWCSNRDSFRCFLKNLEFMQLVATKRENKVKQSIKNLLVDEELEQKVLNSLVLFDPVCTLVNVCQRADCTLAEAAEQWLGLNFPTDDMEIEQKLMSRLKKVINPLMLAANLLHPEYKGQRFSSNFEYADMADIFFLENLTESGMSSLYEYKNENGVFSQLFKKEIKSPTVFWSYALRRHEELATLSLKLCKIPASTAQLERLFSNWSYVHDATRNRLGSEKSKKLLDIYYTLKLQDTNKTNEY